MLTIRITRKEGYGVLPPVRLLVEVVLLAILASAPVFVASARAGVVMLFVVLVALASVAALHRSKALQRGVPRSQVWDRVYERVVDVRLSPESALGPVRDSLAALPHARVRVGPDRAAASATVRHGFWSYVSRVRVELERHGEETRLRASSSSVVPWSFDWGSNWQYLNDFERDLTARGLLSPIDEATP
jgi:hypothetical protein